MEPGKLASMGSAYQTFMTRAFKATEKNIKLHRAVIEKMIHTREGLDLKYLGTYEEQFNKTREYINEGFEKLLKQSAFKTHTEKILYYWDIIKQSDSIEDITEYLNEVNKLTRSTK